MLDYSFFALLFVIATSLSPAGAERMELQNVRHPDQSIVWTRGDDGRWAMTMNHRDVGHFQRRGDTVVHDTGQGPAGEFPVGELLEEEGLGPRARRIRLRGRFAPTVLTVDRSNGHVDLVDPSRNLLVTQLRLGSAQP